MAQGQSYSPVVQREGNKGIRGLRSSSQENKYAAKEKRRRGGQRAVT